MKIAVFSTKPYDRVFLEKANDGHDLFFFEARLSSETVSLADGFDGVCLFVNDEASAGIVDRLKEFGVKLIALRCAGFNNVDIEAAERAGVCVVRVPAYSPYAVAEHTVGLLLTVNRNIHRAHSRVREGNFALNGLLGFDLHRKKIGVIGTGKIGSIVCRILQGGFGANVLAFDMNPDESLEGLGVCYTNMEEILTDSDIITLHCPLTPQTRHIINKAAVTKMKKGVFIINTSRGGLIDTEAVIEGLKSGQIGGMGLDVYEEEADLFFEDLSNTVIKDDVFARLLTFPNVVITGHQAYFTQEALTNIADTTIANISSVEKNHSCENAVMCCCHVNKK